MFPRRPTGPATAVNSAEPTNSTSSTFIPRQAIVTRSGAQPQNGSHDMERLSELYGLTPNVSELTRSTSSSSLTSARRDSRSTGTGSTLHRVALESSHEQGAHSATTVSNQITADKEEVVNIIANYAVEPLEMLHLVDRWMQQLLNEFNEQRDHFKHRLSEKWYSEELANLPYTNHDKIRQLYTAYRDLDRARSNLLSQEAFDELNDYLLRTDDSGTEEMRHRFNSLAEDYSKVIARLEFVDRETRTSSADSYIKEMKKNLAKLKELNNKQTHTICIVGLEKAGKSTFTNALLGYELVPAAAQRCTQVRTVLKPFLDGGDQQVFATVKFYDDAEFQILHGKMVKKTDESDDQLNDRRRAVVTTRDALRTKFPEEHFYANNRNGTTGEQSAISNQLREYITGEVYVNIVKEVSIYTDKLPGMHDRDSMDCLLSCFFFLIFIRKKYELLDVPGFDSTIKEHRDAGLEAIKTADAFVFLTNGQQPNVTEPQVHLLNEIQQNHVEAMQRAFGIITKLDLCQTSAIYEDHHGKAVKELIDKKFKADHIFVACPRVQIINENTEEYGVINDKLRKFGNDLLEGFERCKEALNTFIEYELPKTRLKQLIELGRVRLVRSVAERLHLIKEKRLLPDDLAEMSLDEYIKQQKIESWDRVFSESIFKPAFKAANSWHTTIITKERVKFIEDVQQVFQKTFHERTQDFLHSTERIEQKMYEMHDYSKIQLNPLPVEDHVRRRLCFALEKILDETSDVLANYFYHKYVCDLETVLDQVCPHLKDLFRSRLSREKCTDETHALVLKVGRPLISAALRYSHLNPILKRQTVTDLIYAAPTVAFNIVKTSDRNGSNGILAKHIHESVTHLGDGDDRTTLIIQTLFQ